MMSRRILRFLRIVRCEGPEPGTAANRRGFLDFGGGFAAAVLMALLIIFRAGSRRLLRLIVLPLVSGIENVRLAWIELPFYTLDNPISIVAAHISFQCRNYQVREWTNANPRRSWAKFPKP